MFVEARSKEIENGCFGRMYEACACTLLGGQHDGKEREKGNKDCFQDQFDFDSEMPHKDKNLENAKIHFLESLWGVQRQG